MATVVQPAERRIKTSACFPRRRLQSHRYQTVAFRVPVGRSVVAVLTLRQNKSASPSHMTWQYRLICQCCRRLQLTPTMIR